jgi:hypothetical protein
MSSALRTLILATLLLLRPGVGAAEPVQPQLAVEGTEFQLTLPDGRVLRSAELVGRTLELPVQGRRLAVSIGAVQEDARARGGRVVLHRFFFAGRDGARTDLCTADAEGNHLGFPVPDGNGGFELTCTSGAVGKCIRWGYRPWEQRSDGPSPKNLHRACVHMTRADYGGDGTTHTRDGTLIGIHDRSHIRSLNRDPRMKFEAAWGPDGAICVARPRIASRITLEEIASRYPHLAARLGTKSCSFEQALAHPDAVLFNWSYE